jgi:hypothetical protein
MLSSIAEKGSPRKQYCSEAFLDITQTFHKVWQTGLLYKLKLSLPLNYFIVLKSYLQNRNFLVKIENEYTQLFHIHAGVPKGSVLEPFLQYIYYSPPTFQLHQTPHQQLSQMILQSWPPR